MRCVCFPSRSLNVGRVLRLGLLALLLTTGVARAQERTGRIEGTVYDDDGNPMAGASVTVSSPTQIGGARSVVAGADGSFRFLGLIPGEFTVKVQRSGFRSDIRQGIRVNVNRTVTLDILLERAPDAAKVKAPPTTQPGGIAITPSGARPASGKPKTETYVITAARPVVDVTKAATGESLSDEYVESVPVQNRSYQGVANMTRNVTGGAQGNRKSNTGGNPSVSGGAYFNNTYLVDGMETTDPVTHTFSANFNFDAIADVNIMTGGGGAEYSDTPGGVINMVTKSGSNVFKGSVVGTFENDKMQATNVDEDLFNRGTGGCDCRRSTARAMRPAEVSGGGIEE